MELSCPAISHCVTFSSHVFPLRLSRVWRLDAGGGEEGRLGQSNAATWSKGTEPPWSSVGLFIHSLLRRSSRTSISIIGNFTIFDNCSPEINLQKIPRSMYNTHIWLSRQFYGEKVHIIFKVLRYLWLSESLIVILSKFDFGSVLIISVLLLYSVDRFVYWTGWSRRWYAKRTVRCDQFDWQPIITTLDHVHCEHSAVQLCLMYVNNITQIYFMLHTEIRTVLVT